MGRIRRLPALAQPPLPCPRGFARLLTVLFGLLLLGVVAGSAFQLAVDPAGAFSPDRVAAVTFLTLGGILAAHEPRNAVGWLFAGIGLTSALQAVAASLETFGLMQWVSQWAFVPPFGLLPLVLLVFPTGRLPSPRWRAAAGAAVAGICLLVGSLATAAWTDRDLLDSSGVLGGAARVAGLTGVALLFASTVAAAVSVFWRLRRARGDERQQLKWLAVAAGLLPLAYVGIAQGFPGTWLLWAAAVPGAVTVAILKYRLYDLDLLLNRSLVYGVLTVLVVGGYLAVVEAVQGLVGPHVGWGPLAATGVMALLFEPLRKRVQRGANRLLFGRRDEPYAALSALGRRLERSVDPSTVLPLLAQTVAETLRLPFAGIELDDGTGPRVVASFGHGALAPEAFSMTYQGQAVGRLLVTRRSPDQALSPAERRLLGDLALQAGIAAYAVRLTVDLQRSRERLVRSREEERRRLRRDLHDGVGPSLAGMTMHVGAARAQLAPGQQATDRLLAGLEQRLQACVAEVRRAVDDLRPPQLDELGLLGALKAQLGVFDGQAGAPALQITASGDLDDLPAALEVAAYRIATEAVTNTVRHAAARRGEVRLSLGQALVVEVSDDGRGLPETYDPGVGLHSMRERAEELGGRFFAQRLPEGGTLVRATLPLADGSRAPDVTPVTHDARSTR